MSDTRIVHVEMVDGTIYRSKPTEVYDPSEYYDFDNSNISFTEEHTNETVYLNPRNIVSVFLESA